MTKMHRFLVWLTVLALVFSLAGCGAPTPTDPPTLPPTDPPTAPPTTPPTDPPITADFVYAAVSEAMDGVEATRLKMEMSYEISITEGAGDTATTSKATMALLMDTMACDAPFGSYTLMDMAMDVEGQSMGYEIEVYLVEEEGSVVSYTQMMGMWVRSDFEMPASQFLGTDAMTQISTEGVWGGMKPADLTLDETRSQVNGKEAYVLRGSIFATEMADAFSSLGVQDPAELEGLTLPVVYYVDVETSYIVRMEANMSFLSDFLGDILAESLGAQTENATITVNIPDVYYDLEYGVPPIPAVPQEAYDFIEINTEPPTEPTVYSGPLLLNCGDGAMELRCPIGFTGEFVVENNICMYNEDFSLVGDYYYMPFTPEADVLNLAQINANFLEAEEKLVFHGEGPAIPGYKTQVVIGDGQSYYYAWRQAGDGLLLISVYDYSGTDDATVLLPQFVGYLFPYSE